MTHVEHYERHATVRKVVDGDTLHLTVDLGCDTCINMTVRLAGINAPENSTPEGRSATAFVVAWVATHGPRGLIVRTTKDRREKYGRYLVDLLPAGGGPSLVTMLLEAGHAVPYLT